MMRLAALICIAVLARAESGDLTIHLMLRPVGHEHYEIKDGAVTSTYEISDRGNKRTLTAGPAATGAAPFALQIPLIRAGKGRVEGHDRITVGGRTYDLTRYTLAGLVFGREVIWLDAQMDLACVMTFAGGLPIEAVRDEYLPALPQLVKAGVAQQIKDAVALAQEVPPERSGTYTIVNAVWKGVAKSSIAIRDGRIAASVPKGGPTFDAQGMTLLPGLWEMHTHYSGAEFGPALLAAGITTARDCGGEFDYLVATRDAIEKQHLTSPRLLLAGIVDASGPAGFGPVSADTPEEARAVVARYHAARFEQIKLYDQLKPDVVRALAAEAHRVGMSVTGHVPKAFDAYGGVEAGMDQINHLGPVAKIMREDQAKALAFLKAHNTVVDPTVGWSEMAGHTKGMDVASFEPGISKAPAFLIAKFNSMGSPAARDLTPSLAAIKALHDAGVPLVAGSDTGLIGYGLIREIELYEKAGLTRAEALETATAIPARAMRLTDDARADLILTPGGDLRRVTYVIKEGRMYSSAKLWASVGFTP